MGWLKGQKAQKVIRGKHVVIGPRKPKGSSKKPMGVKEVKMKQTGRGSPRDEIMKWAGTTKILANKA